MNNDRKISAKRASRRVQMDMPERSVARLKTLQIQTEASSYAEVVRNALQLYEALIGEVEQGHKILVDRDGVIAPFPVFGA